MEDAMEEKVVKLVLVLVLFIAVLLYWLLPRTRLARHFGMNETLFTVTAIIGLICGVIGLVATFVWPQLIVEWHLWELIVLPCVLIYTYWEVIQKVERTAEIVDEKQMFDMTRAGALTFSFLIPALALLFIMYQNGVVGGLVWFPYSLFVSILVYSAGTLFYFKRN